MTTRLLAQNIPSAFIRLDATMSDADAYANVRDLQVRAENHNKVIACRIRQPMFALSFFDNVNQQPLLYKAVGALPELNLGGFASTFVFRLPVWVPPFCTAAELVGRLSYTSGSGSNVPCYGWVTAATENPNPPSSATFTVNSTTHARFGGSVKIPPDAAAQGFAMFNFAIDGQIFGSDLKGGAHAAIRDVGNDNGRPYIDADFNNTALAGDAIYILTSGSVLRADIHPRLVVEKMDIGTGALNGTADTDRLYLDRPFNRPVILGSDLAEARAVQGINLYSLSLWPSRVTAFDAGVELP